MSVKSSSKALSNPSVLPALSRLRLSHMQTKRYARTRKPATRDVTTTTTKPGTYLGASFSLNTRGPTKFPKHGHQYFLRVDNELEEKMRILPRQYPMYRPDEAIDLLVYPAMFAICNPIRTAYPAPIDLGIKVISYTLKPFAKLILTA